MDLLDTLALSSKSLFIMEHKYAIKHVRLLYNIPFDHDGNKRLLKWRAACVAVYQR